jgi:iron complex transport system substrate-binding protein
MNLKKLFFPILAIALSCLLPAAVPTHRFLRKKKRPFPEQSPIWRNTVTLPPAEEIKRVVIISPPTTSILLGIIPDTEMIVGSMPGRLHRQHGYHSKLFQLADVETKFVSEGFVSNTEELLNLKPDIVFYYGESQKSGIENIHIPTVDFLKPGDNNPESVTIAWDNLMREIFEVQGSTSLENEWALSDQKAKELFDMYKGRKECALCFQQYGRKNHGIRQQHLRGYLV